MKFRRFKSLLRWTLNLNFNQIKNKVLRRVSDLASYFRCHQQVEECLPQVGSQKKNAYRKSDIFFFQSENISVSESYCPHHWSRVFVWLFNFFLMYSRGVSFIPFSVHVWIHLVSRRFWTLRVFSSSLSSEALKNKCICLFLLWTINRCHTIQWGIQVLKIYRSGFKYRLSYLKILRNYRILLSVSFLIKVIGLLMILKSYHCWEN